MEFPFDGYATFIYSFLGVISLTLLIQKSIYKGLEVFKKVSE